MDPNPRLGLALGDMVVVLEVVVVLLLLVVVVLLLLVVVAGWEVNCNNDDLTAVEPGCGLLPYLQQQQQQQQQGNRKDG